MRIQKHVRYWKGKLGKLGYLHIIKGKKGKYA